MTSADSLPGSQCHERLSRWDRRLFYADEILTGPAKLLRFGYPEPCDFGASWRVALSAPVLQRPAVNSVQEASWMPPGTRFRQPDVYGEVACSASLSASIFLILTAATTARLGLNSWLPRSARLPGVSEGQRLFDHETFGGNSHTCRTCHPGDDGTIDF